MKEFAITLICQKTNFLSDPVQSLKDTKEVFDMSCSPQNGGSTSFNVINYNLFTEKIDGKNCLAYFLSVKFFRQSGPIFQENTFFMGK